MATDNSALIQALVDGGVAPAAAKIIASALANASTPQYSQSRDIADATPREQLRLIDSDTRKYLLTNLDYSPESPYQTRLQSHPGRYSGAPPDHPYKGSQPVTAAPPLSQPAVEGGDYISVDNSIRDGASVSTVSAKLASRAGTHLRINPATKSLDAVPITVAARQGLVTADVVESGSATTIDLTVRGLKSTTVVQANGTSTGILGWSDPAVSSSTIFTSWAQQNLLNKTSAAEVLTALGTVAYSSGSWTPGFAMIGTGSLSPTVTYNSFTVGRWARIGDLVHVTGRVALSAMTSAGNGILAVSGLPFTVLAGQPGHAAGVVGYKTGWITQGPECLYTEPAGTNLVLSYHTPTTIALLTQANLSATADMMFSCTYRTA